MSSPLATYRLGIAIACFLVGAALGQAQSCNPALLKHLYHPQRLIVHKACVSVTGITVDASHGKNKDGCRHEADGDGHCWLKLDKGQEEYLFPGNLKNQNGNLVFEPMCRYRVMQKDAMEACKEWKQPLWLPPVGSHVRITGAWVFDSHHGHGEIHPVSSIEMITACCSAKACETQHHHASEVAGNYGVWLLSKIEPRTTQSAASGSVTTNR